MSEVTIETLEGNTEVTAAAAGQAAAAEVLADGHADEAREHAETAQSAARLADNDVQAAFSASDAAATSAEHATDAADVAERAAAVAQTTLGDVLNAVNELKTLLTPKESDTPASPPPPPDEPPAPTSWLFRPLFKGPGT